MVVFIAGVSAVLARLGAIGSVTGLQLFVYSTLGLGPLGALRPWWHTALQWGVGVVWALLLITPGFLLAPRSAERKAVAAVYHAIARRPAGDRHAGVGRRAIRRSRPRSTTRTTRCSPAGPRLAGGHGGTCS